jgi:Cu-Zn family superoxide dismutase
MRNRTWITAVAGCAALVVALQLQNAQSQERRGPRGRNPDGRSSSSSEMRGESSKVTYAVATVHGLGDHKVSGKVTFKQTDDGVDIVAELSGLQPGEHGFHVHEFGDCSMDDGKCAGAHFNPEKADHGGPDSKNRHVGDLGNIKADGQGHATYNRTDKMISLNGAHSIIGRAVIVHAKEDDFKTVTSAGDRIGCGVIGIADPKMQH